MGAAIEAFLNGQPGIELFEGPTGVGKSIAYLTPLVSWLRGAVAGAPPRRAVVSTGKKTLQAQLLLKDIPHVLSVLGQVRVALMKGKGNYVCRARLNTYAKSNAFRSSPEVREFMSWVANVEDRDGDLEAFSGTTAGFHGRVNVEVCDPTRCEYAAGCGYVMARGRASNAQLVVVNHALLALDLRFMQNLIGPYQALVCDEAHALPRAFRDAFTCNFHRSQIRKLRASVHQLSLTGSEHSETMLEAADVLLKHIESSPRGSEFEVPEAFAEDADPFLDACKGFREQELAFAHDESEKEFVHGHVKDDSGARAAVVTAKIIEDVLEEMCSAITRTLTPTDGNLEFFSMVESPGISESAGLVVTPLEVGGVLTPSLRQIEHVVLTSATLAVGKDARATLSDYGLPYSTPLHRFESSFNYKRNSALYIPREAPFADYSKRDECRAWWPCEMRDLLLASQGGAFILCASYDDLNFFFDALSKDPPLKGLEFIKQEGSIEPAVARFKASPKGVLVGVDSLWEGVDVPGLGLRLVIIPRLPNPNVKDPLLYARGRNRLIRLQERSNIDVFKAKDLVDHELKTLPMCLRVIQGAGRLIRSTGDKGVVAVLDGRLYGNSRGYSVELRRALPHPWVDDKEQVRVFLSNLAKMAGVTR